MSSRYRVVELTPSGYGRRFYAERLAVVRDIVRALGGQWWVRRQWRGVDGSWLRDGGRNDWTEGAAAPAEAREEG